MLARELHWVPDDAYRLRNATALSIASHGYVPALAAAEADQSVPIWLHTHPGSESSPRPSKHDELVDEELADLFRLRAGSPFYGFFADEGMPVPHGMTTRTSHRFSGASGMARARIRLGSGNKAASLLGRYPTTTNATREQRAKL